QQATRRLHVLLVGHAADRALVHVDDVGDLAQRERLQVLDALLEELALPVDDEVHHLEHRLAALLDRLDHPMGAVEPLVDEVLVLPWNFFLSRAISWYVLEMRSRGSPPSFKNT